MDDATYGLLLRWANLAAPLSVVLLCLTCTAALILTTVRLWKHKPED